MCNIWNYGESAKFAQRLIEDIGLKEFNDLVDESKKTKQWLDFELQALIDCLKNEPEKYEFIYKKIKQVNDIT